MDISIFLAKALGVYLLVVSIGMLVHAKLFKSILTEVISSKALLFLSGILALILGILLVLSHNIWQNNWQVVITILAWLALIKGIVRVLLPQFSIAKMKKLVKHNGFYYTASVVSLIVGIFLTYHGFF